VTGYATEVATHSEVARAVAEGRADVGMGVEAAALAYSLPFVPSRPSVTTGDPAEVFGQEPLHVLVDWLNSAEARGALASWEGTKRGRRDR